MIILTIRTDKPEAEIGLFDDRKQIVYQSWLAGHELSKTIHLKLEELLSSQNKTWHDIEGIVCYKGPGSFTGLRIGLTVANTLAYSLDIPIVAVISDNWLQQGVKKLLSSETDKVALPYYGAPAHVTLPKK